MDPVTVISGSQFSFRISSSMISLSKSVTGFVLCRGKHHRVGGVTGIPPGELCSAGTLRSGKPGGVGRSCMSVPLDKAASERCTTLHHFKDHVKKSDSVLPPLLTSLAIEGLPPLNQSTHLSNAEKLVMKYVERLQIISLASYCLFGLSLASYLYPRAISAERLATVGILFALMTILDDLIIDVPRDDFLLGQCGIAPSTRDSAHQMKAYFNNLIAIFSQQSKPSDGSAVPIEIMMWELGRDMLRMSNPEWFRTVVEALREFFLESAASHADIEELGHKSSCLQDVQSYSLMRAINVGVTVSQLMTEFVKNCYLPEEMRSLPIMVEVGNAVTTQAAFVNDIYSYHKESKLEDNPRNIITVLMESEGKTFVEAVHAAIRLTNLQTRIILDLESKTSDSAMQGYLQDMMELIAGSIYFTNVNKRYRQPDSVFPELRGAGANFQVLKGLSLVQ